MIKMNKYYITFGKHRKTLLAETPIRACVLMIRKVFNGESYVDLLPVIFRISERGFDKHDDGNDVYITTHEVIEIMEKDN